MPLLLLAAGLLLVVLCLATMIVMRVQNRERRLEARISLITSGYVAARPLAPGAKRGRKLTIETGPLVRRAAALFGFAPERAAHYPLRWWMVLPLALVIVRLLAGLIATLLGGIALVAVPVAWVILCRFFFRYFDARRSKKLYIQFPDVLATITRAVRVGIPVTESIRSVAREAIAPTTEEFQVLADQLTIGVALEDGLRELAERNSLPEYRFFATALSLQSQTGGGLTETLDNLADVIRKRLALRARAYALASEARTSILILALLPAVAGAALAVLNPAYISPLFFDPDGRRVLAALLMSLTCGVTMMKLIVKGSLG